MWIDHVKQGDDDDQEDWNIDYFCREKERARAKEKGRKAKEETEMLAKENSWEHALCVRRMEHRASECSKIPAYLRG